MRINVLGQEILVKTYFDNLSDCGDSPSLRRGREAWEKKARDYFVKMVKSGDSGALGSPRSWDRQADRPCTSDVLVRYFCSQGFDSKWDSVLAYFGITRDMLYNEEKPLGVKWSVWACPTTDKCVVRDVQFRCFYGDDAEKEARLFAEYLKKNGYGQIRVSKQ